MTYVILSIDDVFSNNITVVPQGVAVSEVRRELTFSKKTKIPILGMVENLSGFFYPRFKVSGSLMYRCSFVETSKRAEGMKGEGGG